jgi:hypothetical protein
VLIQAIEAYYTQNPQAPFVCLDLECDLQFETLRAWAIYASDADHNVYLKLMDETLATLFSEHNARLASMKQEIDDDITRMQSE